jgi:hypothetical protein
VREEEQEKALRENNFFDYQIPKGRRRQVPKSSLRKLAADELEGFPKEQPQEDEIEDDESSIRRRILPEKRLEISSSNPNSKTPFLVQSESTSSEIPRLLPLMISAAVILLLLLILIQVGSVFSASIFRHL